LDFDINCVEPVGCFGILTILSSHPITLDDSVCVTMSVTFTSAPETHTCSAMFIGCLCDSGPLLERCREQNEDPVFWSPSPAGERATDT
jgi:hypothetical protein